MTTLSKISTSSLPSSRVRTEAPTVRAPVEDPRASAPKAAGFDARSNFVDRPTGRRPSGTETPPAALLSKTASLKSVADSKPVPLSGPPVVAVFDGGVDWNHTDLKDSMWTNPWEVAGDGLDNDGNGIEDDIHGFNVGFGSGDPLRGEGMDHGTHVAGIIAAADNGLGNTGVAAGKAQILSVGGIYDGADLLTNFERSVDYVVDMKSKGANIRAVNASFGDEYRDAASQKRWKDAVQKLADADILLVAATANGNGSNMNNVKDFPANLDLPNVLTVASMDKRNDKLARYSSHGDKVVEMAAVGEDVLSTVPGGDWEEMSGTSMATPRVAATAALMFAENPKLTAAEVRDMLVATTEKDPDLKGKVSSGGKLDIDAAVAAARASAGRVAQAA
ncbi:Serine protease subtilase family [Cystobacter fuscus]|uniref:Serine protease subtilase family n=1 Tax=Cystobacter fuscus TaxID=43 RepID=A0A250IS88_9BACT|nr:S8 family peptidase [Cystobacter fuscus]ATB34625.1 Serine protease subtilase family [Cystobacter fuscus]